jgi:hypothetical protein
MPENRNSNVGREEYDMKENCHISSAGTTFGICIQHFQNALDLDPRLKTLHFVKNV